MPDFYFIYAGDGMGNSNTNKHSIRSLDGRVLFRGEEFETPIAQYIVDELNAARGVRE